MCLQNLYIFLDFVAYCYADHYTVSNYDSTLLQENSVHTADQSVSQPVGDQAGQSETDLKLEQLLKENAALREELTARREEQQQTYVTKPLDISEYETRKIYIDSMLQDAGWTEGQNWINEYRIPGMPNKSQVGYADYVLLGDDGKILAVIEAKRTCADVAKGGSRRSFMLI